MVNRPAKREESKQHVWKVRERESMGSFSTCRETGYEREREGAKVTSEADQYLQRPEKVELSSSGIVEGKE